MQIKIQSFDLISLDDENDKWIAQLRINGIDHSVRIKKQKGFESSTTLLVSGGDVFDIFGEEASFYMGNFLGTLCHACLINESELPVSNISLGKIHQAVTNGESFDRIVSDLLRLTGQP